MATSAGGEAVEALIERAHERTSSYEVTPLTLSDLNLIDDLADALAALRDERDTAVARAASLLLHLPDEMLCGDVRKWADQYAAEAAALREDAERYRWLKDPPYRWYTQVMSDPCDRLPLFCVIGKELDAAIDAARARGKS